MKNHIMKRKVKLRPLILRNKNLLDCKKYNSTKEKLTLFNLKILHMLIHYLLYNINYNYLILFKI